MTQKQVMIVSTLLIFILTPILLAQDLPPEILGYADLVLYNGRILTMDRDQTPINVLEAVAVRDGRILATGETDRMLRMAGPDTIRVDLGGKAVIPGIVDTHSHPNSYAARHYRQEITPPYVRYMEENRIRFATVRWESKEAALSDFKTVADSLPSDYWIFATSGLNAAVLEELSRYDLDEVVPDHPVYVRIGNAQYGLANSKMLEIISETYGGKILPGMYTDEQGVPNGRIFGAAGTMIDQEIIPSIPPEILAPPFKKELEEWVAIGVTTLSTRLRGNELTAYGLLDRNGELPLRLGYSHEIGRGNPFLERALKRFGNLQGHGTDRLWMIGITIGIPDGTGPGASSGGGRVCVSMPKREVLPLDFWPDGMCHWDQPGDPGADTVVVANRYGYRVSGVHTFGDKAYLMMLDAYEQADQENPVRGRRFALDHGSMVPPEVVRKSAELGVTWSIQVPMFYSRDPRVISRVWGEEYAHTWSMPVKSLIDAGARVTYGADTHNDPERQPMFNLEVLVTRRTHDGRVFGPRERIERAQALLMMTRWGAEYVLREQELGSIEAGKLADLVILDRDPLDRSLLDEDLSEIKVEATLIGGEIAYDPGDLVQ